MGSEHFADRLVAAIKAKGNPVCVGIDPRLDQIPEFLKTIQTTIHGETVQAAAGSFLEFGKGIIDAVYDLVPCVKPQIAFYEQYGAAGIKAFEETCAYAQEKGLIVIADGKRNDIGTTAEAYAAAYLGEVPMFEGAMAESPFKVDALTVTPYLGYDGIKPFAEACRKKGKGMFVLVKTSNPSSGDLQDQVLDEKVGEGFGSSGRLKNYELIAHLLESWGADEVGESGYSFMGAVVGATHPVQAGELRKLLPQTIFLVPGYGAQGAGVNEVKSCFNKDGLGAIVNSSRAIIFAYQQPEYCERFAPENYADAAREATEKMARELRRVA